MAKMKAINRAEIKKFLLICRTENGERRTENGERRTENGERRTENGERRTAHLSLAFFSPLNKLVKPSATLIGVIVAYRGRGCQGLSGCCERKCMPDKLLEGWQGKRPLTFLHDNPIPAKAVKFLIAERARVGHEVAVSGMEMPFRAFSGVEGESAVDAAAV